jgi:hypothetical protein
MSFKDIYLVGIGEIIRLTHECEGRRFISISIVGESLVEVLWLGGKLADESDLSPSATVKSNAGQEIEVKITYRWLGRT